MYPIISLLALGFCALTGAIITDCGSEVGAYTNITVSNCNPNADRCILERGKNASIDVDFTIKHSVNSVNVVIHGKKWFVTLPFSIDKPNACNDPESHLTCPLTSNNTEFHYQLMLPVKKYYPPINVDIRFQLQDQYSKAIVCALIPAGLQ